MFLNSYNRLWPYVKRHFASLAPFLNIYKLYNVVLAYFEKLLGVTKCRSRFFIARIDSCSACNLHCPACATPTTKTKEKRLMSYDDFCQIIDKIKATLLRVSLYDMGEPLLNKDIYRMISYVSDNRISSLISTNFNLFSSQNLEDLFASRLTILEPCLDGFNQESYQKYRCGGDVEKVKNNIVAVMDYKRKHGAKYPIVDVQVVKFKHLEQELPLIDQFLKDSGVDRITYRQEVLGFDGPTYTANNTKPSRCFWLYFGLMIRPDGNVYPCCGRDFDRFAYGNILTESIDNIWNNKYYQFSRQLFTKGGIIDCPAEFKDIPCLNCAEFKKFRSVRFV